MNRTNGIKLAAAILISQLAGIIGTVFTSFAIPTWYATLEKPALNPPSWVFGPVWTALYTLMGIALFLIWKQHSDILENVRMLSMRKRAFAIFFAQLVLNALWSIIFFGLKNPGAALFEIILLWLAIIATIYSFSRLSKAAAWLLVPYLLWVSFATYLNFSIWNLN